MSEILAAAIYRAKAARQTPYVINQVKIQPRDTLKKELDFANETIGTLRGLNNELMEKIDILSRENLSLKILKDQAHRATAISELVSQTPKITEIAKAVCRTFDVSIGELRSTGRQPRLVIPRQVAIYLARKLTGQSYPVIADCFNRDHTTAMHAFRSIEKLRQQDENLNKAITTIENLFVSSQSAVEDGAKNAKNNAEKLA